MCLSQTRSSGNAFIYILISVLLLGALTFAISRGNDSNPSGEISDAAAKAAATSILAYEAQARSAVDRMMQSGGQPGAINFMLPSNVAFNTAPTINKIFHPEGGGLDYRTLPAASLGAATTLPSNGYYIGMFNNFSWTPTASNDIIFTAYGIGQKVCQELNRKITGSTTIPNITAASTKTYVVDASLYSSTNSAFTSAVCASCEFQATLCVANNTSNGWTFYSILLAR